MILVTGATGNLGSSVILHLSKYLNHDQFVALARNKDKAKALIDDNIQVRIADFDEPASLVSALVNIDRLVLISTMDQNRLAQHKIVIDAAKAAKIKHIIYTSLAIQDISTSNVRSLMQSHFDTEDYIKQSGIPYTIMRNTMYAEAIPQIIGLDADHQGIRLAGGMGKVPYALRDEMGEAIANVFIQSGHQNKTYHITGSWSYSYQELTDLLSEIKGSPLPYTDLSNEAYRKQLQDLGLPEFLIYLTTGTLLDIKQHQYEMNSTDLEQLLGRKTASIKSYLQQIYL